MAEKTTTQKKDNLERVYVIPLRAKYSHVPRYKKTPKAVKSVKEFLVRHMKVYDRDLNKIKIDKLLNEYLWFRGIKKPPYSVKVKAIKDDKGIVRVELAELPNKLKFKQLRQQKIETKAQKALEKKKKEKEALQAETGTEAITSTPAPSDESKEKKSEAKEKTAGVEEAGKQLEKAAAKKIKHETGGKSKGKTQPQRKALAK